MATYLDVDVDSIQFVSLFFSNCVTQVFCLIFVRYTQFSCLMESTTIPSACLAAALVCTEELLRLTLFYHLPVLLFHIQFFFVILI
jgi:hypothetical protein